MKLYYHANCLDGFTAAWIFHGVEEYNEAEFFPLTHTTKYDPPGDIREGETLTFVDISPPAEVIKSLLAKGVRLFIYDHHVSEESMLDSFRGQKGFHATFDVTHSGAGIAWYTLHRLPPPDMVAYVQDRDIWKWDLPGTREYTDALYIEERTFKNWDSIVKDNNSTERLLDVGSALGKTTEVYLEMMIPQAYVVDHLCGKLAVINAPPHKVSDLLHRLVTQGVNGVPVVAAVSWAVQADGSIQCSIRGDAETTGVDVSKIAALYKGGGHKNAGGFTLKSITRLKEWLHASE